MTVLVGELEKALARPIGSRVAAVTMAALVVAAVLAFAAARRSEMSACIAAASEIDALWNPARSGAMRQMFLTTTMPYAEAAWRTVDSTLSAYSGRWRAERQSLCPSSMFAGASSVAIAMREHCLNRRKAELAALTDVLARADGAVVENAALAVHSLTPPERCVEMESPQAGVVWPADSDTEAAVRRLQDQAAQVKALIDTGQSATAIPSALEVVAKSRDVAYLPLLAEAQYLAGKGLFAAGKYDEAETMLWETLASAEAASYDEIRLRTLLKLATLASNIHRDSSGAETLARLAHAVAARVTSGADVKAELAGLEAELALYEGRPQAALPHAEQAVQLATGFQSGATPSIWWQQSLLAWILKDLGRLDEALAVAERSLSLRRDALGDAHPEVAKGLYNRAAILADQLELDQALRDLTAARDIAARTVGPEHLLTLRFGAARAEVLDRRGDARTARAELEVLLPVLERVAGPENARVGETLEVYGRVLMAVDEPRRAEPVLLRALSVLETNLSASHPWLAAALVALGECRLRLGAAAQAVAMGERALLVLERADGAYVTDAAHARFLIARASASSGGDCGRAYDQALKARCLLESAAVLRKVEIAEMDAWLARPSAARCAGRAASRPACPTD